MKETNNFGLKLYEDSDVANLINGYNNSMNILDDILIKNIYKKPYVIIIGDSFSDNVGGAEWPTYISGRYNVINEATSGAGFVAKGDGGNRTFREQLIAAANYVKTNNINVLAIKRIIVYGGANDSLYEAPAIETAVNAFFTELENSILNSVPICFIIGNIGCSFGATGPYERYTYTKANSMIQNFYNNIHTANKGYVTVVNGSLFNTNYIFTDGYTINTNSDGSVNYFDTLKSVYSSYYKSDMLHPSDKGSFYIANYMSQIIESGMQPNIIAKDIYKYARAPQLQVEVYAANVETSNMQAAKISTSVTGCITNNNGVVSADLHYGTEFFEDFENNNYTQFRIMLPLVPLYKYRSPKSQTPLSTNFHNLYNAGGPSYGAQYITTDNCAIIRFSDTSEFQKALDNFKVYGLDISYTYNAM